MEPEDTFYSHGSGNFNRGGDLHEREFYSMSDPNNPRTTSNEKETVLFRFGDKEYNIYGD